MSIHDQRNAVAQIIIDNEAKENVRALSYTRIECVPLRFIFFAVRAIYRKKLDLNRYSIIEFLRKNINGFKEERQSYEDELNRIYNYI